MGFYVPTNRDVKFPKACEQCYFYDGLLCCVMDTYVHDPENKHEECPLIEIPDNHGRLGDLDKLEQMFVDIDNAPYSGFDGSEPFYSAEDAAQIIRLSPTIIPEDEMI